MNSQECANLVERIIQTWPTGVRGRIWTETLTNLDHHQADTAYTRLRAESEHPPTVARFLAVYRSLDYDRPTSPGAYAAEDTGPVIPPSVGKQVAWQAYVDECLRTLRTPNRDWFNTCLGQ